MKTVFHEDLITHSSKVFFLSFAKFELARLMNHSVKEKKKLFFWPLFKHLSEISQSRRKQR